MTKMGTKKTAGSKWTLRKTSFLKPFVLIMCFFVSGVVIFASNTNIWSTTSRTELLKGDSKGVSISDSGMISLAPKLDNLYDTSQAFIWSAAVDSGGTAYLGTGHDGKIFKVSPA